MKSCCPTRIRCCPACATANRCFMSDILVTGGAGQLASALAARAPVHHVGRPDFDFDRPATIETVFGAVRPRLVINAAAYTAVDKAESDQEAAWRANRDGPAMLA